MNGRIAALMLRLYNRFAVRKCAKFRGLSEWACSREPARELSSLPGPVYGFFLPVQSVANVAVHLLQEAPNRLLACEQEVVLNVMSHVAEA